MKEISLDQLLEACETSTEAFNLLNPDKIDAPKHCIDRTGLLVAVLFAKGYKKVIIKPGATTIHNPDKDEGLVVGQGSIPGSEENAHVLVILNDRYVIDVAAPFDWLSLVIVYLTNP